MSTSHQLMTKIDEIKQKMSTQDYLDLCNLLKKKSEEDDEDNIWKKLFLVKYFEQSVQLKTDEYDNSVHNEISRFHVNESLLFVNSKKIVVVPSMALMRLIDL
jgi:predicted nucleotidyltransferase component of viral defense system